jgi:hypothetical protein
MVADAGGGRSSACRQSAPHRAAFCAFSRNCHRILQHHAHLLRGGGGGFAPAAPGQRHHAHDLHIQRFFDRHSRRSRAKQVRPICFHLSAFKTCVSLFNWLLSGSSFLILILLLLFYQNQDRRALLDA